MDTESEKLFRQRALKCDEKSLELRRLVDRMPENLCEALGETLCVLAEAGDYISLSERESMLDNALNVVTADTVTGICKLSRANESKCCSYLWDVKRSLPFGLGRTYVEREEEERYILLPDGEEIDRFESDDSYKWEDYAPVSPQDPVFFLSP